MVLVHTPWRECERRADVADHGPAKTRQGSQSELSFSRAGEDVDICPAYKDRKNATILSALARARSPCAAASSGAPTIVAACGGHEEQQHSSCSEGKQARHVGT